MNTTLEAATAMAKDDPTIWRVDDALWTLLEPVLRIDKPRITPGRPRRDDRAIFDGLIWLARTGAQWSQIHRPRALYRVGRDGGAAPGLGGAAADVRRGTGGGLVVAGRRRLHRQGAVRQKGGAGEAQATGANPTDRAKPGSKRHLLTAAKGIPIAVLLTGANRHDMKKLAALLDAIVIEPDPSIEPHLALDRGFDYPSCRDEAAARGYTAHIPPKASAATPLPPPGHPDRHPPRRWVVEVAHAWFNRFRRLLTRWEKQAAHYLGFVQRAASLIIYRKIRPARLLSG